MIWLIPITLITAWIARRMAMLREHKIWNDGTCQDCGYPWELYKTLWFGERVYTCAFCQHRLIISWPIDQNIK